MSTTVYDINTRYTTEDRSSKTMLGMGGAADQLWGKLSRVGALLAGGWLTQKAKSSFIDFNAGLESMQAGMQANIAMNRAGVLSFDEAGTAATGMVDAFQRMAAASPATTKEFVGFADMITGPLLRAGGTIEDIKRATYGGVLGSNVFHIDAEQASRDIESVLAGTLSAKDRFARALLEPMGYTTAAINAMDGKKRLKVLLGALENPSLIRAGQKIADTWNGQWSTLVDNIEMGLGKVGIPLFKQVTAEVKSWNTWLDRNKATVEDLGRKAGKYLVDGFHALKDGVASIVDHKDTLLQIAAGYLALKSLTGEGGVVSAALKGTRFAGVPGAIGTGIGLGAAGYAVGSSGPNGSQALGVGMGVLGAAAALPGPQQPFIAGTVATLYVGKLIADYMTESDNAAERKRLEGIGTREALNAYMKTSAMVSAPGEIYAAANDKTPLGAVAASALQDDAITLLGQVRELGAITDDLTINGAVLTSKLEALGASADQVSDYSLKALASLSLFSPEQMRAMFGVGAEPAATRPSKRAGDVNINIARMEVASADPERFAFGLQRLAARHVRSRSVARDALPAGG